MPTFDGRLASDPEAKKSATEPTAKSIKHDAKTFRLFDQRLGGLDWRGKLVVGGGGWGLWGRSVLSLKVMSYLAQVCFVGTLLRGASWSLRRERPKAQPLRHFKGLSFETLLGFPSGHPRGSNHFLYRKHDPINHENPCFPFGFP